MIKRGRGRPRKVQSQVAPAASLPSVGPTAPEPKTAEAQSLKAVIDESLGQNEAAEAVIIKPSRGRPPKTSQAPLSQAPEAVGPIEPPAPTDVYEPHITHVLTLAGDYLADQTQCAHLKTSEEEAKMIAEPGSEVLSKYFPATGGAEASPEFKLLLAVATVAGGKFILYRMHLKERELQRAHERKMAESRATQPNSNSSVFPIADASPNFSSLNVNV